MYVLIPKLKQKTNNLLAEDNIGKFDDLIAP